MYQVNTLNSPRNLYQPHLTLAGVAWKLYETIELSSFIDEWIELYPKNDFQLVLGEGDDIGQYVHTLYDGHFRF